MDPVVVYYFVNRMNRKTRKRRRYDVHPINRTRFKDGVLMNLYTKLREDDDKFFNYFRMSMRSFDELVVKVGIAINKYPEKVQGLRISKEEMLCVTLRFMATGNSFHDLGYYYRLGVTTIAKIVKQMVELIWIGLANEVFPAFSEEMWRDAAEKFKKRAHFPHWLGAIDGKHVRIVKPQHSGSTYFNYKHYFSVVILAVVDSDYKFQYVDVGSYGKDADPTIFRFSSFGVAFNEESLDLPKPEKLTPSTPLLPYVFVADDAFELSKNLLRPYPGQRLTRSQRIFNYRLSTARRFVECAFGILSNKWRLYHTPLCLKISTSIAVIKATCALHNDVRDRDGFQFQDTLEIVGLHPLENEQEQHRALHGRRYAYTCRNKFAEYFCSAEGSVPWQDRKVQ